MTSGPLGRPRDVRDDSVSRVLHGRGSHGTPQVTDDLFLIGIRRLPGVWHNRKTGDPRTPSRDDRQRRRPPAATEAWAFVLLRRLEGTRPFDTGVAVTVSPVSLASLDLDPAFALHRGGKLEVRSTVPVRDADDLSLAYTPGVARVCSAIADNPELANDYTWVSNVVAVVSDGTAVLG